MSYEHRIRPLLTDNVDPRHVEAYMRLEHRTLDGLSDEQFAFEVQVAQHAARLDGAAAAEKLAGTFGL